MGMKSLELLLALRDKTTTPIAPKISRELGQDVMSSHNTNWNCNGRSLLLLLLQAACRTQLYKYLAVMEPAKEPRIEHKFKSIFVERNFAKYFLGKMAQTIFMISSSQQPRIYRRILFVCLFLLSYLAICRQI
jgi:hypothetical protein